MLEVVIFPKNDGFSQPLTASHHHHHHCPNSLTAIRDVKMMVTRSWKRSFRRHSIMTPYLGPKYNFFTVTCFWQAQCVEYRVLSVLLIVCSLYLVTICVVLNRYAVNILIDLITLAFQSTIILCLVGVGKMVYNEKSRHVIH